MAGSRCVVLPVGSTGGFPILIAERLDDVAKLVCGASHCTVATLLHLGRRWNDLSDRDATSGDQQWPPCRTDALDRGEARRLELRNRKRIHDQSVPWSMFMVSSGQLEAANARISWLVAFERPPR